MKIWAESLGEFIQTTDLDMDMGSVTLSVMENNIRTPLIYLGNEGEITANNLPENRVNDSGNI